MGRTPDDRRQVRAGDADRERVLASLRRHAGEGRLEMDELAERIEAALRARTLGELSDLTADLPAGIEAPPAPVAAARRARPGGRRLLQMLVVDLLFVVVWLAAGRGYFWPIWAFVADGLFFLRRPRGERHRGGPSPRRYDGRLPDGPADHRP